MPERTAAACESVESGRNDLRNRQGGTADLSNIPLEPTLPRRSYLAPEAFEEECAAILRREWFCAGREDALAAPGDFHLHELAGERVIVTRTREGALKAFYNVCRHRGTELVSAQDPGSVHEVRNAGRFPGAIRCPYHAWAYEFDGRLRATPFLDDVLADCRESLALHPVGLDVWGGYYFLNLDFHRNGSAPGLAAQLGPIPERVRRYGLDSLRTGGALHYDVRANWKVILENYNECYHCGPVHPELCEVVPAFRQGGGGLDWDNGVPHRAGADTYTLSGTSNRASLPGLDENERINHKGELIYPNLMLSLSREHAAGFRLWPIAPDRTVVHCEFLFHPDEMARDDFDPSDVAKFWDVVNRQDWEICERVQRGMNSAVFDQGYYAPMEDLSLDIRRYVAERLARRD